MPPAVDPITVSVIQHRLVAIVEEMGEAMLRTSYSQILNSSRDFSTAICDARCRLVAQAEHIPVHVGAMPWAAKAVADYFGDTVEAGDLYVVNDPYHGGSHLPDVTVFVPVFVRDRVAFWTINRAHHSDIGGATHGGYNPSATEIWHEGIRITPIKLHERRKPRQDLVDMLAANVRHPRDFRGDLAAQIGSVRLGERRVLALIDQFGPDTVDAAIEAILDGAERRARAEIERWKDGVFHGEAKLDDDGHGRSDVAIRATVTKRGGEVEVDLTASDPQSRGFVNSSHANMQSAVAMALAYLIDPATPKNEGTFRPLKVVAKPGTIVWAEEGAPVTMCTSHCSNEICEAVIVALAGACPDRAMGGWGRRFRVAIQGRDPRSGRSFIWHMFQARPGGGGSAESDGFHSIGEWHSAGGLKFGSIEVAEVRFPLFFRSHELNPDSAGDGRHRGGLGGSCDFVVETDGPAVANTAGDGARYGARGILGGEDGRPHRYVLHAPDAEPRVLPTKLVGIAVPPGSMFEIRAGGGGGWGPPAEREAALRERDRIDGIVTGAGGEG